MNLTNFNNVKETIMEQYKNPQDYQLELKQIVEFPRCRIYRDFIRSLITNKDIRTNGGSFLFYYIVLPSYRSYDLSCRTWGMDLHLGRSAHMVPVPFPASGSFDPGLSAETELHHLLSSGE